MNWWYETSNVQEIGNKTEDDDDNDDGDDGLFNDNGNDDDKDNDGGDVEIDDDGNSGDDDGGGIDSTLVDLCEIWMEGCLRCKLRDDQ